MKLRKIKWENHPILQDLELDFVNSDTNSPYNSIFIIGENGCGKTTVMESLSEFLCGGPFSFFDYIEYELNNNIFQAKKPINPPVHQQHLANNPNCFEIINLETGENSFLEMYGHPEFGNDPSEISLRNFGSILSKARSDFKTEHVYGPQNNSLDNKKKELDNEDSFNKIKQLIVDIYVNDQRNISIQMEENPDKKTKWNEVYPGTKISRFKNAFNNFFEGIKFKTVDINNEIIFSKFQKDVNIDKLSTGEKQIVFRGVHLLKNRNLMENSTIFIDEPELSMHPKWQEKIIDYFKDLFRFGSEIKAQLFFATHSDHVLKGAFDDLNENLVIRLNNNSGNIESEIISSPAFFPIVTLAATKYFAYNLCTNDFHIELYSYIQDRTNKIKIKDCDTYIASHLSFIAPIHGRISLNGSVQYQTLPTYIRNKIHHPTDNPNIFSDTELKTSTELLLEICRSFE